MTTRARGADPVLHYATCTLCEAICGIEVETEGDRVLSIRGDKDDPFSRGHICPKAAALADLHDDPDRLRRPVVRDGTQWREVGWAEAYDRVARGLTAVRRAHGNDAVAVYLGNPNAHSLGAMLLAPRFVRGLRTRNRYSASSVDQLPHQLASHLMFGHQLLVSVPDLDRTDLLVIFGANPAVSNGSLMTAPDVVRRLKAIRSRGGRVIVIDPRRTETAGLADAHHFVRPGTDALVLLAMLNVLFDENLVRFGRCESFVTGVEEVRAIAARFPPERTASATGLPAKVVCGLARELAAAERGVCYGRLGVSTQEFGALACWLVNVLNIATGHLDAVGGAMFPQPALDLISGRYISPGGIGRWRSRVRGLPEVGGELPVAALAEEIETPGDGQVRALVTIAGNPVLSTPNGRRLDRALATLDFIAAVDCYVNETTRHAHVILPPTSPLERDHYDLIFNALAVQDVAKFSPAVFPRAADARHDWEIFNELAWRTAGGGAAQRLRARGKAGLQQALGLRGLLDIALRRGPRGAGFAPWASGLTLRRLREAPHGIVFGPLQPCLPGRLVTKDRRIQLAPTRLLDDVPRLEQALQAWASTQANALVLIGRRDVRSNNSWMHNSARLMKGKPRCTLLMHPSDAAARGLSDGVMVRVRARAGEVAVPLRITEDMAPGVVSLPHGWGHDRPGVRLSVASASPGASVNDLTDELRLDAVSANAAFNGTPVEVEAVSA